MTGQQLDHRMGGGVFLKGRHGFPPRGKEPPQDSSSRGSRQEPQDTKAKAATGRG